MVKSILLFDVDGTLTHSRMPATDNVKQKLKEIRSKHTICLVSGSDIQKVTEQMGQSVLTDFDFVFAENGLHAFKSKECIEQKSIGEYLGESLLQEFINFSLLYLSELKLPFKRGTFFELRNGMINISPVGRNCSKSERNLFEQFDRENNVRFNMIQALKTTFCNKADLVYSIGGQISFDVFPNGWDKRYCLNMIDESSDIHFFGDKVYEGGNDYQIYNDPRVIGHEVNGPEHTLSLIDQLF